MFKDLLQTFKEVKTRCFINGMPKGDGGVIVDVLDDYLVFEIVATKERIFMPLDQITHVTKGMKPNPIEIVSKGKTITIQEHEILNIGNGEVMVREKNEAGYVKYPIDHDTEELLRQITK
jgi:hypothetical protein